jgi:hypothetical protein
MRQNSWELQVFVLKLHCMESEPWIREIGESHAYA